VEVDDRRDVAGDVGDEEVADTGRWSWIDPGSIVAVGIEDAHERERGRAAALAGVEEDDRDVAGAAVEVAQQRGGAKERVHGAGAADQREGAVDLIGVAFACSRMMRAQSAARPSGPSIRGMIFDLR
jgi:hypothetical protein